MEDLMLALSDVCRAHPALQPPNRMRVSEGVAQILMIKRPGGGSGAWNPTETPYMVKPMDMLASRRHAAVCFVGPAQTGKALDVDTPIPTPDGGWVRMGDLVAGDRVYGDEGDPCTVTEAHPVRLNRPCFRVELEDGSEVVADEEHLWRVWLGGLVTVETTTTVRAMVAHAKTLGRQWRGALPTVINHGPGAGQRRRIVAVVPVQSRPVRCIRVDGPRSMFLAGRGMVPTHNTVGLVDGWMAHAVVNDPGDMAIFQMTQDKAREYSKQRLDRAIKNSPRLQAMRSVLSRDDNLHDKQFRNGMWVKIAWPTATNMASTSYRYVAGTDYDRWPDDIDGEGDGFTLMGKRTTTFLSRGMVMIESSPGRPITDPSWRRPPGTNEAPPVGGIGGVYNRSNRERWHWKCSHCREWFEAEPGLGLFGLPHDDELLEGIRELDIDRFARQHARIPCPHCGVFLLPSQRETMNRAGLWLPEGLLIDDHDRISGDAKTSSIAGFWLGGVAATYVTWEQLIRKHLQALLEFSMTGSELQLMTTANTDQGVPYMSRLLAAAAAKKGGEQFDDDLKRYVVPEEGRFLVASVDVQGGKNARFEVEVHAIGEHQEQWLVNRFSITKSKRPGMGEEFAPIDPAKYPEDWDILTERVVQATYQTSDPDLEMRTKLTTVDTGGEGDMGDKEGGVTNNAYAWYRRLRKARLHRLVRVIKGVGGRVDWHIKETMVGGKQGEGDIPLQLLASNKFKDIVDANLQRQTPGPGYYHFPRPRHPQENPNGWLPQSFYDELKAEVRNANGVWEQIKKRNETFDLCCMIRAGCMMLGADKRTFWDAPPAWALPHAENSDVVVSEIRRAEQDARTPAPAVAPAAPNPTQAYPGRQVRRSSYLD